MRIEALLIQNFRGISRVEAKGLGDTVIIAGQNGSGKSCIFDAIRLLKSTYGGYQQKEWQQFFGESLSEILCVRHNMSPRSMYAKQDEQEAAAAAALPTIPKELIDQFVSGPMSAEAVNAASMAFKKALIERALGAELSHHLGYPPGADKPEERGRQPPQRRQRQDRADRGRAAAHRQSPRDRLAVSSPCSSPSTSAASPASTTRSSPCTPAA
jgi:putative transposase